MSSNVLLLQSISDHIGSFEDTISHLFPLILASLEDTVVVAAEGCPVAVVDVHRTPTTTLYCSSEVGDGAE